MSSNMTKHTFAADAEDTGPNPLTNVTVVGATVGVSTPVLQGDAGGAGARPVTPQTASTMRTGVRQHSDPPPRSRQRISGDPPPELPLIGFTNPSVLSFSSPPGTLTGTANLATRRPRRGGLWCVLPVLQTHLDKVELLRGDTWRDEGLGAAQPSVKSPWS